ncbi:MAG: flagellar basal body P-ring protein FlgI, partial [Candidatus Cloacimonetes bacterium]|nr:flagellar basal body P-ring protein FlgI [Candidatus Cloacimonadota bacterium]
IQSINNMLEHFGLTVPQNRIRPNNVAAVMVTAILPPFAKPGSSFDVVVSSIGDARSLEGGVLLMTPLISQENLRYAVAQGPISFGGFNEEVKSTKLRKNYSNVGRIPNGAVVETENISQLVSDGQLEIQLFNADFTTAELVAGAINDIVGDRVALAENAANVSVTIPDNVIAESNIVSFISIIENLEITPQQNARVIINERTGTIVAGGNVRINEVAIAHGNLIIKVKSDNENLSAGPFSLETESTEITAQESSRVFVMESATVQELAQALNAIKVTPRDMISIFQSLKESGALHAELRIM